MTSTIRVRTGPNSLMVNVKCLISKGRGFDPQLQSIAVVSTICIKPNGRIFCTENEIFFYPIRFEIA
ncbi:hypothetical protein BpHYR1_035027 [Brachionus plicatilis]|uniref:Uncharacterized protein n=1 Tax=Brachionus plicatilis TaxID=10195 RepID=A0A3M7QT25_BRAPC|nr:hypothetical protein BpHYR1_035027 [Brachionus plicatilis]